MKVSKKIMSLLMVSVISIGIVGCSSEQPKKEATGNDTTKQEKQVMKNLLILLIKEQYIQ